MARPNATRPTEDASSVTFSWEPLTLSRPSLTTRRVHAGRRAILPGTWSIFSAKTTTWPSSWTTSNFYKSRSRIQLRPAPSRSWSTSSTPECPISTTLSVSSPTFSQRLPPVPGMSTLLRTPWVLNSLENGSLPWPTAIFWLRGHRSRSINHWTTCTLCTSSMPRRLPMITISLATTSWNLLPASSTSRVQMCRLT